MSLSSFTGAQALSEVRRDLQQRTGCVLRSSRRAACRCRRAAPFSEATARSTLSNTPWLWILVFVTVSIAAFAGYFVTSQLTAGVAPDAHSTGARQEPRSFLKASPVASGELAGKSVKLLEAGVRFMRTMRGRRALRRPSTFGSSWTRTGASTGRAPRRRRSLAQRRHRSRHQLDLLTRQTSWTRNRRNHYHNFTP